MKVLIYFTIVLLISINVLKTKKYLLEVAEDNNVENPACKCGIEREGKKTRIVGGTEVDPVRLTFFLTFLVIPKSI